MTGDPKTRGADIATLVERASLARRLAAAIPGDGAALQLEQLATELDAKIALMVTASVLPSFR
jgi:hypothetical protein